MSTYRDITKLKREINYSLFQLIFIIASIIVLIVADNASSASITLSVLFTIWGLYKIITTIKNKIILNIKKKIYEEEKKSRNSKQFDGVFEDMFNDLFNEFKSRHSNNEQRRYVKYNNPEKLKNAYELLRLNSGDTVEKIKKTYKTLAIKWHPDKWSTSTEKNKTIAERNFVKLQSAYELIKKDKNIT